MADEPLRQRAGTLLYVGGVGGMERGIVTRESELPYRELPAAALRGRGPVALARGLLTLGQGLAAARRLISEVRPTAILGTGGYVCVPLFIAARAAGVPTLIYLPDVVPGLAVQLLARVATAVALNVEDAIPYFRGSRLQAKMTVTGYPVRPELFKLEQAACREVFGLNKALPVLLVYGGSRGARSVNRAIETLLPDLLALAQVIHICGREGDESWLQTAAQRLPEELRTRYRLYPYLESGATDKEASKQGAGAGRAYAEPSMITAFGAADLAVCRSGASTLAELPAAGLPAVLVPYPYVHQDENADYLVRRGAAVKVQDALMLGTGRPQDGPLFQQVRELLRSNHKRRQMADQSRELARSDAAGSLAKKLLGLATRSGG